jgi:putative peptide zinc metalloprotease protein
MLGVVCRGAGGEVPGFGVTIRGILPRFEAELEGVHALPRRKQLWVLATPLLVKLTLFSLGVLLWTMSRASGTQVALFSFTLAAMSLITFIFTGNPFGRSDGHSLLSAYLGMPNLRGMAFGVLFKRFLPENRRLSLESSLEVRLRIYALVSITFMLTLLGVVLFFIARWLEATYQGTGVVIFLLLLAFLGNKIRHSVRLLRPGKKVAMRAHENFDLEVHTRDRDNLDRRTKRKPTLFSKKLITWTIVIVALSVISILPYPYETGGAFELRAIRRQEIHAEIEMALEKVFYRGGEWVKAGTLVAKLSSYQQEKDIRTTKALIKEQEAELQRLLTTPREEEVVLKMQQLATAQVEAKHAREEFKRLGKMYEKRFISQEEYEDSRAKMEVAEHKVLETEASLALTKAGPHPEKIQAVKAELERLHAQLAYYQEQLQRTRLFMPFDGRLTTSHLEDLVGKYLKEGDLFSVVEDDSSLEAEIEVPESDIGDVVVGATVRIKMWAFPNRTLYGSVTKIDPVAVEKSFGKVVPVTIVVPTANGELRSGMTGHGKVEGGTKLVIVAFTRWLVRFVTIEIWSWIP